MGIIHEEHKDRVIFFLLGDHTEAYTEDVSISCFFFIILMLLPFIDSIFFVVFIVESGDRGIAADFQHKPKTLLWVSMVVFTFISCRSMQHCAASL